MPALVVQYRFGGVYLPELGLWLDPTRRQTAEEVVFISHAHTDHIAAHREVVLTAPTSKFIQARLKGERLEHVLAFDQPAQFKRGGRCWQLTLHPAGHILGSAMARVELASQTVLYTGDFKLRPGLAAETCQPQSADLLIMETTFGRPKYRFPERRQVLAQIVAFCHQALAENALPVLLAYSLGKSQELLCGLHEAGLPVVLHPTTFKNTRIYEFFGQRFPPYEKFKDEPLKGKVLIWPAGCHRPHSTGLFGPVRTAVVTGWAIEPSCRYRSGVDAAFPLSDHADFDELIEFVKRTAPRKVCTLHGFAADFAQTLREMGFDAQSLSQEEQLSLPLVIP